MEDFLDFTKGFVVVLVAFSPLLAMAVAMLAMLD